MPKVSIIMPIYNVEQYLEQCLNSCINQTLEDIEIICVNDGSPDNSIQILENYAKKDARIKIINQENQGISASRNNGLYAATGEYVLFLDSDDWLECDCCELSYNQAKNNDNDFVYFNHSNYYGETNTYIINKFPLDKLEGISSIDLHKLDHCNFMPQLFIWNKLYNRQWLITNNMKFIPIRWEDNPFTIQAMLNSTSISVISKPLYVYRRDREGSEVRVATTEQCFAAKNAALEHVLKDKDPSKILNVFIKHYIRSLVYWYNNLSLNKQEKKSYKKLLIANLLKLLKYNNVPYKPQILFWIVFLYTNTYSIYLFFKKLYISFLNTLKQLCKEMKK